MEKIEAKYSSLKQWLGQEVSTTKAKELIVSLVLLVVLIELVRGF